jgi:hypothetical protein
VKEGFSISINDCMCRNVCFVFLSPGRLREGYLVDHQIHN